MEKVKKGEMTTSIKEMEVGEVLIFDRSKYSVINSTLWRIRYETGKKLTMKRLDEGVMITRLA